jgi:hypothetical protein
MWAFPKAEFSDGGEIAKEFMEFTIDERNIRSLCQVRKSPKNVEKIKNSVSLQKGGCLNTGELEADNHHVVYQWDLHQHDLGVPPTEDPQSRPSQDLLAIAERVHCACQATEEESSHGANRLFERLWLRPSETD